jgi:hypothetical protein
MNDISKPNKQYENFYFTFHVIFNFSEKKIATGIGKNSFKMNF